MHETKKVFTHRTIPASLKEIRPAVSEIQMLTGRTKSDDYRPSGLFGLKTLKIRGSTYILADVSIFDILLP